MTRIKGYKKTIVDGIKFDSKREAKRYTELRLLEKAGKISDLKLQVKFLFQIGGVYIKYPSGRQMYYKPDFFYFDEEKKDYVIEDAKGHLTETYKIKRALMLAMGHKINEV